MEAALSEEDQKKKLLSARETLYTRALVRPLSLFSSVFCLILSPCVCVCLCVCVCVCVCVQEAKRARDLYEQAIQRPYFHNQPLDLAELQTWCREARCICWKMKHA